MPQFRAIKIIMTNTAEKEMTRFELLKELAKYAHPDWYRRLLAFDTKWLRCLLNYYEN